MYTQLTNKMVTSYANARPMQQGGNFIRPNVPSGVNGSSGSIPTNPVSYLGYEIGKSLGTTDKDSPITQSLIGISDLSKTLQDGSFWLNVGGVVIGSVIVLIAVKGMVG